MNLLSQTATLFFLSRLHPEANDALKPHLPVISEKVRSLHASSIIKSIAKKLDDVEAAGELHKAGRILFNTAAEKLNYDDELFPSQPKPWYEGTLFSVQNSNPGVFVIGDEVSLNPQPLPPHELKYYGGILIMLADSLRETPVAAILRNTGIALLKQQNDG